MNAEKLEKFLTEMNETLENGETPEEIIRTVENSENGDLIGIGSLKPTGNNAELKSAIIKPNYRNHKSQSGKSLYNKVFEDRLDTGIEMMQDDNSDVDIIYTQLLADKSAATQHVSDKNDFAVTGVHDARFPLAYKGKGRVTVVDMIWADSNITNDQDMVYVPPEATEAVQASLENINNKRSDYKDRISRTVSTSGSESNKGYKIETNQVGDPMNFAEVRLFPEDNAEEWQDVENHLDGIENNLSDEEDDDDYWIGVYIDANSPECIETAEKLKELGFEFASFNPGKLDRDGERRDSLEMQLRNKESYEKQFIPEAADFIDRAGIEYEESDQYTGYNGSVFLRI